ncbi:MAG: ATP-dependent helicase UvrD/PcrA [Patescibacteria group bacterium]|nr:ATP-dependent helicase UvrD/PcrA [Patescibacteria group bacterium]
MFKVLEDLNEQQREAVLATDGPVLMLAGAGSGKTKTLTHRLAYLVQEKKVDPANILAVTFTNKAAGEMRRRVARLLKFDEDNTQYMPFLGTFHSIANRILRREAAEIGFGSNFLIYDSGDSHALIKTIIKKMHLDEKQITPSGVANVISSAKNELIGPGEYKQFATGRMQEVAAEIYPTYQLELQKAGALDFDDLIMRLTLLLAENDKIRDKYQRQFQYIMVDEYQDTNHAQYRLIQLLAKKHQNICVVGDDWQSIYSWRGANYENILNFEKDYPEAKIVKLERNYRSTQVILDAAGAVISRNTARSEKKLWTNAQKGDPIQVVHVRDELEEGRFIIQTIQELIKKDPRLSLHDFAVLYRTNAQSRTLEESFLRYGVGYQIIGGVRFYERKEIKDTLAYLRFIFQPNDLVSFNRIVNLPPRGLGQKSLQLFTDYSSKYEIPILECLAQASVIKGLSPKAANSFMSLARLVSELQESSKTLLVSDLIELVINRSGYIDYLEDGSISSSERVENVRELLSVAKEYNNLSLEEFLTEISLISDLDNLRDSSGAVTLMTLHAAKGLEYDTVFITGLEEGIFPHSRTFFEPGELEEERRLCYVGMTRAKQRLYMLSANARLLYGNTQHNVASRFLAEIPADLVNHNGAAMSYGEPVVDAHTSDLEAEPFEDIPRLSVGDAVSHPSFGRGRVSQIDELEAVIEFDKAGSKTLNLNFAHITKI